MPKLTIDNRDVEVREGATVLDAARALGIDIPALCFREGCSPSTSCLACVVRINGQERFVPSCGTAASDGMRVESETPDVRQARRTALELLLSDHLGDCVAPCQFGCPAKMDIPLMLRHIAAGRMREAIATIKRAIAMPAVLGRICPAPCEKVCRRSAVDAAVSICQLKRFAADVDLASDELFDPTCKAASGKSVAIVGAGPTGLSAAYYLRQFGHAAAIFDGNREAGGRLLCETTESELPRAVLHAEIAGIVRNGVAISTGRVIGPDPGMAGLLSQFDAVLVACGDSASTQANGWQLAVGPRGILAKPKTFETNVAGVFAAGNAIRGKAMVVRSVADGKDAATAIDQYLNAKEVTGVVEPLSTKIGPMTGAELAVFSAAALETPRKEAVEGFAATAAFEQAARCMHCDCRGQHSCKLRKYAAMYGADPKRFKEKRRVFVQDAQHAEVIYEPGKCIDCGLCIQIASAHGEPLGLTFVGRGFDVRVAVPLDRTLAEALTKAAAECVAACPTAALAWRRD